MVQGPRPISPPNRQRRRTQLWSGLMVLSLLAAIITGLLALAPLLGPGGSRLALLGSVVWPVVGPHLVLLSLFALLLAVAGLERVPKILAAVAITVAFAAVAGSAFLTGQIVRSIHAAGGSVSLSRALWLSPMTAAEPDATETYAEIDGQNLQASVFLPGAPGPAAPVLLYFHGGGFMAGTRLETAADLRWFADRGWLAVSVDYRLWTDGQPTWDKAPRDVACALVWRV
jgi:acetyl esterase